MLKAHQTLRNTRLIQVEPDLEFSWKKDSRLLHRATVYPVFRHHVLLNHRNFLQTDKHFTSQLSYRILKGNILYTMFFSHSLPALCLLPKALL